MRNAIPFLLLWLFTSLNAQGQGSVWAVRHGTNQLYLGGTCHVLRPKDYPLPSSYDAAYHATTSLVLETDLSRMESPEVQAQLLRKGLYQDGTTLSQTLSPDVYRQLLHWCRRAGLSEKSFVKMKPSLAVVTLTFLELQQLGVDPKIGVDLHFRNRATKDRKRIIGLETVQEQLDLIVGMGQGDENRFVRYSLKDLDDLPRVFDELVAAWRSGNLPALEKLFVEEMKAEAPKLYREVIVDRNRKWLPSIEQFLKTPEQEFVLVGVGHLVGPDGVIELLRAKGYEVTHLNAPLVVR